MMAGQNKSSLYNRQNDQKISIGKLENMLWTNDWFHVVLMLVARDWECPIIIKSASWLPVTSSALGQKAPSWESS